MKKRFLAMFLTLAMCLALLPTAALADEQQMNIKDGVLTECYGSGHITIPDTVTRIENMAFWFNQKITGVTIPDSVTSIGYQAFQGCTNLTSIVIPDSVTSMGDSVFSGCINLASVDLSDNLTAIGENTFSHCRSLTEVTVPEGVTSLGMGAFRGCSSLTSIELPETLTSTGQDVFQNCESLTSVTLPDSLVEIGDSAFYGCTSLTGVVFPKGIQRICQFQDCTGLTEMTFPDSITTITDHSFFNCSGLTRLTIPASVTSIEAYAFYGCEALKDIYYLGTQEQWQKIKINADGNNFFLSAAIHYSGTGPDTQPDQPTTPAPATPTNDKLAVDGKDATPAAYKIGSANYFKLRDVAMMVNGTAGQFSVDYADGKITIVTGQPYTPIGGELGDPPTQSAGAEPSNDTVYINGEQVELAAYKIGGANFYGIRDLARRLGFNVGWAPGRGMYIESGKPYTDAD